MFPIFTHHVPRLDLFQSLILSMKVDFDSIAAVKKTLRLRETKKDSIFGFPSDFKSNPKKVES